MVYWGLSRRFSRIDATLDSFVTHSVSGIAEAVGRGILGEFVNSREFDDTWGPSKVFRDVGWWAAARPSHALETGVAS